MGRLNETDRRALFDSANRLGIDPYQFGAVISQETAGTFDPNIVGGEGGNYYGLIQFGRPERTEAGLDPQKIGNYSIAEQLPHVEKWLLGRGYKPGMGVEGMYKTILGGNPGVSGNAKDSFGTSVNNSLAGFQQGGDHYKNAQSFMGALPNNTSFFAGPQAGQAAPGGDPQPFELFTQDPDKKPSKQVDMANFFAKELLGNTMSQMFGPETRQGRSRAYNELIKNANRTIPLQ